MYILSFIDHLIEEVVAKKPKKKSKKRPGYEAPSAITKKQKTREVGIKSISDAKGKGNEILTGRALQMIFDHEAAGKAAPSREHIKSTFFHPDGSINHYGMPSHFRGEGDQPHDVHGSVVKAYKREYGDNWETEHNNLHDHAISAAFAIRGHLRNAEKSGGQIPSSSDLASGKFEHHVHWTSGPEDIGNIHKQFGTEPPKTESHKSPEEQEEEEGYKPKQTNPSDLVLSFRHKKTGETKHVGISLKYGTTKNQAVRGIGKDSMKLLSGHQGIGDHWSAYQQGIRNLPGFRDQPTDEKRHRYFRDVHQPKVKAGDPEAIKIDKQLKQGYSEALTKEAEKFHAGLSTKTHQELHDIVRQNLNPPVHAMQVFHVQTHIDDKWHRGYKPIIQSLDDKFDRGIEAFGKLTAHREEKQTTGVAITGTNAVENESGGKSAHALTFSLAASSPFKSMKANLHAPGFHGNKSNYDEGSRTPEYKRELQTARRSGISINMSKVAAKIAARRGR